MSNDDFAEVSVADEQQETQTYDTPPETPMAERKAAREELLRRFAGAAGVLRKGFGVLRRIFRKESPPNLVLVMVLITVITAAVLGAVYSATQPHIEAAKSEAFDAAMGAVFPGRELTFAVSVIGPDVFEGRDADGELVGFSVRVSPAGYAGPIDMIVGINLQREVTGVVIVSQRETRGFDAKGRMQNGFLEQFTGQNGPFAMAGQIDAVSGATVSSQAVTQGVNDALALLGKGAQP